MGHEKDVNLSEVTLCLLYDYARTGRRQSLAARPANRRAAKARAGVADRSLRLAVDASARTFHNALTITEPGVGHSPCQRRH